MKTRSILLSFPVAVLVFSSFNAAAATTYRVTADVVTEGDGQSWASPMSITNAVASATTEDDVILCKAGEYTVGQQIVIATPITVSGGLAGTDDTTLAADPVSTFNAMDNTAFGNMVNVTATSGTVTFERITFTRGYYRGVYKTGAASIAFANCRFYRNGVTYNPGDYYTGAGASLAGASAAEARFTDCVFDANAKTNYPGNRNTVIQGALYATGFKRLYVENCGFYTNCAIFGISTEYGQDRGGVGAIYANAQPVTIVNSRFVGNNVPNRYSPGGVVCLSGACTGSVVSNCLFTFNGVTGYGATSVYQGALLVTLDADTSTLEVEGCTFAYNTCYGNTCSSAFTVNKGDAKVRNSIFYGNNVYSRVPGYGRDLSVLGTAKLDIDYSLITASGSDYISCYTAANYTLGGHMVYDDPLFGTDYATADLWRVNYRWNPAYYGEMFAADFHEGAYTNGYSRAIDMGDPASPYANEPEPNGGRINLGAYGNTAEAATSSLGASTLTAGDIDITFSEYAQPTVSFTNAADAAFNSMVTVEIFTADPQLDPMLVPLESLAIRACQTQDVVRLTGVSVYTPGSTIYVRVTVAAPEQEDVVIYKSATVTGQLSPYVGHGGGATVLHVREGATGDGSGSDWFNALGSMSAALALAQGDATKTEIWVAGTVFPTEQSVFAYAPAASELTIRGGFTGLEDALSERPDDGSYSTLDGGKTVNDFLLANASGHAVFVERLNIVNMVFNGISKTGGGNLTVYDCMFQTNGYQAVTGSTWAGKGTAGKAIRVQSASGANIVVSNCVLRANRQEVQGAASTAGVPDSAMLFSGCASAQVVDCDVIGSCSLPIHGNTSSPGGIGNTFIKGSAIQTSVPTVVTGSRFTGNFGQIRSSSTAGGVIWFASGSTGSVVSNCLFAGNVEIGAWNNDANQSGCIVLELGATTQEVTVDQCTFGFNVSDATAGAAGISIVKGTLNLANSVFGCNMIALDAVNKSADLKISAYGQANVSYTLFGGDKDTQIYALPGGVLNEGDGIVYQDPGFVSPLSAMTNLLNYTSGTYTIEFKSGVSYDLLEELDLHVMSAGGYVTNGLDYASEEWPQSVGYTSPAVDAADPLLDVLDETTPNGGRRNAGYYGGTEQASRTMVSTVPFGVTDVAVTYPDGYSRPQLSFTVTGDEGLLVNITVTYTVDGGTPVTETFNGSMAGSTYTLLLPEYYVTGTALAFSFDGSSTAGSFTPSDSEFSVTAERPPYYGHGGGDKVLHVWKDAPGTGCGTNWLNACRTWNEVRAAWSSLSGIEEIWVIDVDKDTESTAAISVSSNLVVRGGFSNMWDSAEQRLEGAKSTVDPQKSYDAFIFTISSGTLEVERIVFTGAPAHGLTKSGAGDLWVHDCDFWANARDRGGNFTGRGLCVSGTAGTSVAAVSNCTFRGNGMFAGGDYNLGYGAGAYFANQKRVYIDDCLFMTNGVGINSGYGRDVAGGTAVYATTAPLTMRNTKIIANTGTTRDNSSTETESNMSGGAVRLEGNCDGSAFTNCLFAGNSDWLGWDGQWGFHGGSILVKMSSADYTLDLMNCTVAYNLAEGYWSPGGLNVYKGTVTAKNSIFFGNQTNGYTTATGCEVDVKTGTFNADWCLFTGTNEQFISTKSAGTVNLGEHIIIADPIFVTPYADVIAQQTVDSSNKRFQSLAWLTTINLHLRGKQGYIDETTGEVVSFRDVLSPAIDAGDPASSFKNEAKPNGGRVNLGFYGNTSWATMSGGGGSLLLLK